MSEPRDTVNFLSPHRFEFTCTRIPDVTFFVVQANLPDMTMTPVEEGTPFNNLQYTPDKIQYSDLVITFMVDENMTNYRAMYDWFRGLGSPENFEEHAALMAGDGVHADATMIIQTNNKNANILVEYKNILPYALTGVAFDTTMTDVDFVKATVTFRIQSFSIRSVNT